MLLAYRTSDPSCKEVDNLNTDHKILRIISVGQKYQPLGLFLSSFDKEVKYAKHVGCTRQRQTV